MYFKYYPTKFHVNTVFSFVAVPIALKFVVVIGGCATSAAALPRCLSNFISIIIIACKLAAPTLHDILGVVVLMQTTLLLIHNRNPSILCWILPRHATQTLLHVASYWLASDNFITYGSATNWSFDQWPNWKIYVSMLAQMESSYKFCEEWFHGGII